MDDGGLQVVKRLIVGRADDIGFRYDRAADICVDPAQMAAHFPRWEMAVPRGRDSKAEKTKTFALTDHLMPGLLPALWIIELSSGLNLEVTSGQFPP